MQLYCIQGIYIRMKPARAHTMSPVGRLTNLASVPVVDWDTIGVMGSLVCLAHCLLLPLVVGVILFEEEWLVVALTAPALFALMSGWRTHGKWVPGFFMVSGLIVLNSAAFATPENWEAGLTVLGGLLLIGAHGLNYHLRRCCLRCVDGGSYHS